MPNNKKHWTGVIGDVSEARRVHLKDQIEFGFLRHTGEWKDYLETRIKDRKQEQELRAVAFFMRGENFKGPTEQVSRLVTLMENRAGRTMERLYKLAYEGGDDRVALNAIKEIHKRHFGSVTVPASQRPRLPGGTPSPGTSALSKLIEEQKAIGKILIERRVETVVITGGDLTDGSAAREVQEALPADIGSPGEGDGGA